MIENPVFVYVDDDLISCRVMEMILQRGMQYEHVTIMEDSADFMQRVRALSPQPNVFLLDIRVDPIDGFDMLKLLRADPEYAGSLIVAITASVMSDEVDKLKDAGFDGGLSKPVRQREFPDQMRALLAGETVWHIR